MSQGEFANPFAVTPSSAGELMENPDLSQSEAVNYESIRRQYLQQERAVNSISTVFFFSAIMSLLMSVLVVAAPFLYMLSQNATITGTAVLVCLVLSLCLIGLVVLQALVAIAMRRRMGRARYAAMLLAAVGLFAFPFGTIFGVYILIVMGAKETPFVMSDEYKKVIKATPQYDVAPFPWTLVALVLTAIIATLVILLLIG
jgi:hypothetical protein